jgi:S-adenosylmethionine decarboxylase
MFFEGSEKKIEVIFKKNINSLRLEPETRWHSLVKASKAQILSKISNKSMDAYLLSESSLFVYDHYLVMITCGTTRLISAVEELMTSYSPQDIDAFFYERKNELLPREQSTDFFKDVKVLKKWFQGDALRFGREDEHHLFLFSSDKNYQPEDNDHTMEVLMHGIDEKVMNYFINCKGCDQKDLREKSGIANIVLGEVDDYVFEPMGYSLNSIYENRYFTIHVTPENMGSYISFETNAFDKNQQIAWAKKVLQVFKPMSFDLVFFNNGKTETPKFDDYIMKRTYADNLNSGYHTQYFSFYKPDLSEQKPVRFKELV